MKNERRTFNIQQRTSNLKTKFRRGAERDRRGACAPREHEHRGSEDEDENPPSPVLRDPARQVSRGVKFYFP